jgi:hypothetical protein
MLWSGRFFFVALHPVSRRRSYYKFSAWIRSRPAEVSHFRGLCSSTAHERGFAIRRITPSSNGRGSAGSSQGADLKSALHREKFRRLRRDMGRTTRTSPHGRVRPLPGRGETLLAIKRVATTAPPQGVQRDSSVSHSSAQNAILANHGIIFNPASHCNEAACHASHIGPL